MAKKKLKRKTRVKPRSQADSAQTAVKLLPWVSVEVPSFEESYRDLVKEEKILEIAEMGVKQLNLAEMAIPLTHISNASNTFYRDEYELYRFACNLPTFTTLSPVDSRFYTYGVFEYAHKKGLSIRINDCSNEAKYLQTASRIATGNEIFA